MGQLQSVDVEPVCVPIPDSETEDHSVIFRNKHVFVENGGQFISTFRSQPDAKTIIQLLKGSSIKFANEPAYGERPKIGEEKWDNFKFITFKQFYDQAIAFGKGLLELGFKKGDKVGIYSANCTYWQTVAYGCASVGIIFVPVYDSLGPTAAEYIIKHCEAKALFTSEYKFENAKILCQSDNSLTHLITFFDEKPQFETDKKYMTMKEIIELGRNSSLESAFADPEDTALIMYTSGSTGVPKGCVLTHANIVAGAAGFSCLGVGVQPGECYFSFLPLAHIYALVCEIICVCQGAAIAHGRGPTKYLIEDIQLLRPTMMTVVPRILNTLYGVMQQKIKEQNPIVQKLIHAAIKHKASNAMKNKPYSLIADMLLNKFREALGGRLRIIVNGGAPVQPEVFEFICAAITPNILQGYGLTETSAGVAVQQVPATNGLTVGPPGLSCEVCMRPVPNTEYNVHDEYPCGELLVRGPIVFKGYYKQDELTKESILPGGWFATGDIVKLTKELDLQIIDRAKFLVKLCQGEYVSITTLSELYSQAEGVACIYIYANPMYQYLSAVVFPTEKAKAKWKEQGIEDIEKSDVVKKEMLQNLAEVHDQRKMRGFERIKYLIIDQQEPTVENGLLTPSMKPQFAKMKKLYEERLLELYKEE